MDYLLGIDIGSSSVKACVVAASTGEPVGQAFYPKQELSMDSPKPGFAQQDPWIWYECARTAVASAMDQAGTLSQAIKAVGISYQMHGLVCVDSALEVLRPAIIWCDSRAVDIGNDAFHTLGQERCLSHLLNSPGNFTASKLKWVKKNEPRFFERIHKIMLPGDWLAYKLTGEINTTQSGLSEGIFWDFLANKPCDFLLDHYGLKKDLLAPLVPNVGFQGGLTAQAASEFGLMPGIPVSYRGGDQPSNALSLNVLNPGEVAATAGTSGVVYGVTDKKRFDPKSRINSFLHINHAAENPRLGILLCINGTGVMNAWIKRLLGNPSYEEMDELAAASPEGSDGLLISPFGNGAERVLENVRLGAELNRIDFLRHDRAHVLRAVQEGIVFSLNYGMEIMAAVGVEPKTIRACAANMFKSRTFCETLSNVSGAKIELFDTDAAAGAARGAGVGAGIYESFDEAFSNVKLTAEFAPNSQSKIKDTYLSWKQELADKLESHSKKRFDK